MSNDQPQTTDAEVNRMAMDIGNWHDHEVSTGISSVPDFWDECDASDRLAAWLVGLGYRKGATMTDQPQTTADDPRMCVTCGKIGGLCRWTDDAQVCMPKQLEQLRQDVIAFCAPWAASYARDRGLPDGHLDPIHYDILARCGARMNAFTRAEIGNARRPTADDPPLVGRRSRRV